MLRAEAWGADSLPAETPTALSQIMGRAATRLEIQAAGTASDSPALRRQIGRASMAARNKGAVGIALARRSMVFLLLATGTSRRPQLTGAPRAEPTVQVFRRCITVPLHTMGGRLLAHRITTRLHTMHLTTVHPRNTTALLRLHTTVRRGAAVEAAGAVITEVVAARTAVEVVGRMAVEEAARTAVVAAVITANTDFFSLGHSGPLRQGGSGPFFCSRLIA
jgi:hypothetical protein